MFPASPPLLLHHSPQFLSLNIFQHSRHSGCTSQPTFLFKASSVLAVRTIQLSSRPTISFNVSCILASRHTRCPTVITNHNFFCIFASRRSRGPVVLQILSMSTASSQSALFGHHHSQTRNSLCIPCLATRTIQPSSQLINPWNFPFILAIGTVRCHNPYNPFLRESITIIVPFYYRANSTDQTSRPRDHIICISMITIVHNYIPVFLLRNDFTALSENVVTA
jgi:hypothetical protein